MLSGNEMVNALGRHITCNWGYVTDELRLANDNAAEHGRPVFSVHYSELGIQFYLITEADRSATLLSLADE